MVELQPLPYLGAAEPDVLFVEWLQPVGTRLLPGMPLATVETLKAAFTAEATTAGVLLQQLVAPGERVAIQAPIAVVGEPGESYELAALLAAVSPPVAVVAEPAALVTTAAAMPPSSASTSSSAATSSSAVAPAARRRASELGIDLRSVRGSGRDGLVRLVDVEQAHAARTANPAPSGHGRLEPEFLAAIRRDPGFATLSSEFKLQLYRRHGAVIGPGSKLGAGVVLLAETLVLGPEAYFGDSTRLEVRELIAGELLHFGVRCRIRCTRIECGDNAFFADDIEIGGGGAMDPEALLAVGSHGFVGEHCHLNPCRPLRIGDEVVISRSACLMTHSFGPSWLRGYPSRFAGVTIGDAAQIGIQATVFPGVEVGAGAVVMSGSAVVTAVAAGRLYGGVPAQDLKAAAVTLSAAEVAQRASELVQEFARQLQLRGMAVDISAAAAALRVLVRHDGALHELQYAAEGAFAPAVSGLLAEQVLVATELPAATLAGAGALAAAALTTQIELGPARLHGSLGPLASAFREFLRKRGHRLEPRSWAYRGGWL